MLQGVTILNDGRPGAASGAAPGAAEGPPRSVDALVGQVIAMLRPRDGRASPLDRRRIDAMADRMIAAGLAPDPAALGQLAAALCDEGLSPDDLADCVMPAAARALGRAWEDDRLSFVEVTLVMTRLQRLLRSSLFAVPQDGPGPNVLFVLPAGAQHTLGGILAVRQLRRMRCSACLVIGEAPRRLLALVQERRFDAVFVSVSTTEGVEIARDLVSTLRAGYPHALPVAVGGAILCGTDLAAAERVRERTGAAIASNDLAAVLAALNLAGEREPRAETA